MWRDNKEKEKKPCELQEKTYIECLERYNHNSYVCRGEISWLKFCGEFEQWVEQTIQEKIKQAKVNSTTK